MTLAITATVRKPGKPRGVLPRNTGTESAKTLKYRYVSNAELAMQETIKTKGCCELLPSPCSPQVQGGPRAARRATFLLIRAHSCCPTLIVYIAKPSSAARPLPAGKF